MARSDRQVPLSAPDIGEAERAAVLAVLDSGRLSLGPELPGFEARLARYVGVKHAVAVSSGTAALHLCMKALGIGRGDEVITTPFSFVASASCILYEGATPVFVDIDPVTLNLDVSRVERCITPRTRAILPVHVFGLPCDMDPLCELARRHALAIVEDACEAIGATYRARRVGSFGDCGVLAFYPNKQMTTGEGGAIVTDRDDVAALCRSLRNQGRGDGDAWLAHERLGYNYRLSDLQCAIGSAQVDRLDEILGKRDAVARRYASRLATLPGVEPLPAVAGTTRSWFVYVVLLPPALAGEPRNQIIRALRAHGVGASNYFPPIHLQPFFAETMGFARGDFPVTEAVSERTLALPFHSNLSGDDVEHVVDVLAAALADVGAAAV